MFFLLSRYAVLTYVFPCSKFPFIKKNYVAAYLALHSTSITEVYALDTLATCSAD